MKQLCILFFSISALSIFADASPDLFIISDQTFDYYDLEYEDDGLTFFATEEQSQHMQTITRKDIEALKPIDVPDLLEKKSNITIKRYGPQGNNTSISLRGLQGGRVLILINGIPANSSQSGECDLSRLSLSSIEEIQVIKGGSDSKFNYSGAIGGIINILTNQSTKNEYYINGSISNTFYYPGFHKSGTTNQFSEWYDFFDSQKVDFNLGLSGNNVSWQLHGKGLRAANHFIYSNSSNIYRRQINNEIWNAHAQTSLHITLPQYMSLNISGTYTFDDKNIPGPMTSTTPGKMINQLAKAAISYNANMVGHPNIDTEFITSYTFDRIDWEDPGIMNIHNLHTISIINHWNFIVTDWLTMHAGGDCTINLLASNHIGFVNTIEGGGYITAKFNIKDTVELIPSVKLIYFKEYPIAVPKLGFILHAHDNITLKSNVFRFFKYPPINALYWPEDSFALGNPDLKPEDGIGADIILDLNFPDILTASSTIFANYLINAILWAPGNKGKWFPDNIDKSLYFGTEQTITSDFSKYVTLRLSYTFLLTYALNDNQTIGNDVRIPYAPLHSLSFGADFSWKTGSVNLTGRFESERFTSLENLKRLPPYFTLDITFNQKINIITLFISIKNVLNTSYMLSDGYPMPGGMITAGITLSHRSTFK